MKRKNIPDRIKLKVFKRDRYTCKFCGKSPVLFPEVILEADHKIPVSEGGTNDIENIQTSCLSCNRGKGNLEELNRTVQDELIIMINDINPEILNSLHREGVVKVVAEQSEFEGIKKINDLARLYDIIIIPNTIIGMGAGKRLGIYTLNDSGGAKVNFQIRVR